MKVKSKPIFHILLFTALLTSMMGSAISATIAHASGSSITVNTTADQNNTDPAHCSLREAITAANNDSAYGGCTGGSGTDTIIVPQGTYILTITGANEHSNATGDLNISSDMIIRGAAASTTTIEAAATSGSATDRVFNILFSTVNISGVTIANGNCGACIGGGILNSGSTLTVSNSVFLDNVNSGIENENNGVVTITNSTFSGNSATDGGGLMNDDGTITITNSTFAGNTASQYSGGVYNSSGSMTIRNSTFSANSTFEGGAGITNASGATLNLANTIVANSTGGADCYNDGGTLGTNVNNLIVDNGTVPNDCKTPAVSADPMLDSTLALNGGSTPNLALLPGSPAIGAGDNATCAASPVNNTSQNGVTRPQGAQCDIGSYELNLTHTSTIRSVGGSDGWVLESSENSNVGGSKDSTATTLRLGADATKKQYRGVLSFGTGVLPDTAIITKVTLKLTRQGVTGGGNPVTTFQGFMLDMKKGFFGTTALEKSDFQAAASHIYGPKSPALVSGAYSFDLTSGATYINKAATNSGLTQIRVRFKLDDNNNAIANYLSLYSGNYANASVRPALIIQYYVP